MLTQSDSGGHSQKSSGVEIGLGTRYWGEPQVGGKRCGSRKWAVFEFFMVVFKSQITNLNTHVSLSSPPTQQQVSFQSQRLIHLRNTLYPVIASLTTPLSLMSARNSSIC